MLEQALALAGAYDVAIMVATAVIGILTISVWTIAKRRRQLDQADKA